MSGFNPVANASRVRALEGKREKELEELERKRKEAEARSEAAGLMVRRRGGVAALFGVRGGGRGEGGGGR